MPYVEVWSYENEVNGRSTWYSRTDLKKFQKQEKLRQQMIIHMHWAVSLRDQLMVSYGMVGSESSFIPE